MSFNTPMSLSRVSFTFIYTDNKGLCNRHTSVKSVLGLQKLQTCDPAHRLNSSAAAAEATSQVFQGCDTPRSLKTRECK